jgi:alcohol dehydrogenase
MSSQIKVKAAVLEGFESPLKLTEIALPKPQVGEAFVRLQSTTISPQAGNIFTNRQPMGLSPPMVPGYSGIGTIEDIGPDATKLERGDLVYVDSVILSKDDVLAPEVLLQGWMAFTPGAQKLQSVYKNGSFAEGMVTPVENLFKIPKSLVERYGVAKLSWIPLLLVSYGQLRSAGITPGATVLISPATGWFSSLCVPIALAMGAGTVIAAGRNKTKLETIVKIVNNPRVKTFMLTGDAEKDAGNLATLFPDISAAIDFLPSMTADTSSTLSSLLALRHEGTLVLGGGALSLQIPYMLMLLKNLTIKGQMMYEKKWVPELISLLDAGLIDLGMLEEKSWPLYKVNEAVKGAKDDEGIFKTTLLSLA